MAVIKFSFILLLLLLFLLNTMAAALTAPAPSPTSDTTFSQFLQTRCACTRYPSLCFSSLTSYTSAIHQDPVQLAVAATNISLIHLRSVSTHLHKLAGNDTADNWTANALKDCLDSLGDAKDYVKQSISELKRLVVAVGTEVAWRVSNVQTWMSAALTNEETCTDGFDGVGMGKLKADVEGGVERVKEYTSNALALVNHLGDA